MFALRCGQKALPWVRYWYAVGLNVRDELIAEEAKVLRREQLVVKNYSLRKLRTEGVSMQGESQAERVP